MDCKHVQKYLDSAPALAAHLYGISGQLHDVEVYAPGDTANPAHAFCCGIAKKLKLQEPPYIMVIKDRAWPPVMERWSMNRNTEGIYFVETNTVCVPQSFLEGAAKGHAFPQYIIGHEHVHAKHQEVLTNRRQWLWAASQAVPAAITLAGLTTIIRSAYASRHKIMQRAKDQDTESQPTLSDLQSSAILTFLASLLITSVAAVKTYYKLKELSEREPSALDREKYADGGVVKLMHPDDIARALLDSSKNLLLKNGMTAAKYKTVEKFLHQKIEEAIPEASAGAKMFSLSLALADYCTQTIVYPQLPKPRIKWDDTDDDTDYPNEAERILFLKDMGIYGKIGDGFRLK